MGIGGGKHAIAGLFALLIALSIALSGCTSNKYVPCCTKGAIYDELGNPLPAPKCIFENGSSFGGSCFVDSEVPNVAACDDGKTRCNQLDSPDACEKTFNCEWDAALVGAACRPAQDASPLARWVLPVCTDLVPKSCVDDRCLAMMCGYTNIRPAPPPASSDWKPEVLESGNPGSVIPANDLETPALGLQGMTCDFNKMDRKLYNKVKSSRGALWVNSFRFGVGSSFGDYEASKYFFPSTDWACSANPNAKIDRFTNYLGYTNTYCKPKAAYYTCEKNGVSYLSGLAWDDETACKLFCGGGAMPYSCKYNPQASPRYVCNQDHFAYEKKEECTSKCALSNPNKCTTNESSFPYLDTDSTDSARYRMKYVSDVMYDSSWNTAGPEDAPFCIYLKGPTGESDEIFNLWLISDDDGTPIECLDYAHSWPRPWEWTDGPWFYTYSCHAASGCDSSSGCSGSNCCSVVCPGGDKMGELRPFFDNHAYSALDFDYDYYVKKLASQYPLTDQNERRDFECASSSECMSGSCDTTYYNRPMCLDAENSEDLVACQCSIQRTGTSKVSYPACNFGSSLPAYADRGYNDPKVPFPVASEPIYDNSPLFHPDHAMHTVSPTHFKYYFPAENNAKPALFSNCEVYPETDPPKKLCIMKDIYCVSVGGKLTKKYTDNLVIKEADSDGICHYHSEEHEECYIPKVEDRPEGKPYWAYPFNLNSETPSDMVNSEKFGNCKLNGKLDDGAVTPASPPYLEVKNLGWCSGCTYSTLAVQKVTWGNKNPGGEGNPRLYSCYEYRGEFNYVPGKLPYGRFIGDSKDDTGDDSYQGTLRWGSPYTPSTEPVRKDSNPAAYLKEYDGNLISYHDDGVNNIRCADQWHSNNEFWYPEEIPSPSAPYLKEKLTSYLQSNIMPILDEVEEKTYLQESECGHAFGAKTCMHPKPPCDEHCPCSQANCDDSYAGGLCTVPGSLFQFQCPLNGRIYSEKSTCNSACISMGRRNNGYNPLSICKDMGGDGGVLHVIGDTLTLGKLGSEPDSYGKLVPSALSYDMRAYLGWGSTPDFQSISLGSNIGDGKKAILSRTDMLKEQCKTPPLVGIDINPSYNTGQLIGTSANPGILHKFFYDKDAPGYVSRVARGTPDKQADKVDVLMLQWYPTCTNTPGVLPGEKEVFEIERKADLARALLGNFSKPSLIWKFGFPENSHCDKTFFLDYLFNQTSAMVDSGIIGIIYSDWSGYEGRGVGPESQSYPQGTWAYNSLKTGLTDCGTVVRGSDAQFGTQTFALDGINNGKGELFCAMQAFSKRVIGFSSLTYGQKIYAENKTCFCEPCTSYDYITGVCDKSAPNSNTIPQLYCNDGQTCAMPPDAPSPPAYNEYKCEPRCINETACILCNSTEFMPYASFCRFSTPNAPMSGYSLPYRNMSDLYWEFLTGLSPQEKCCLEATGEGEGNKKYTYNSFTGTKQQSEFLQFPRRGELGIDCGRAPDTTVLSYCNIRVPISQKEIACMMIINPPEPVSISQPDPGYLSD